jgi:hypothetical protein
VDQEIALQELERGGRIDDRGERPLGVDGAVGSEEQCRAKSLSAPHRERVDRIGELVRFGCQPSEPLALVAKELEQPRLHSALYVDQPALHASILPLETAKGINDVRRKRTPINAKGINPNVLRDPETPAFAGKTARREWD